MHCTHSLIKTKADFLHYATNPLPNPSQTSYKLRKSYSKICKHKSCSADPTGTKAKAGVSLEHHRVDTEKVKYYLKLQTLIGVLYLGDET